MIASPPSRIRKRARLTRQIREINGKLDQLEQDLDHASVDGSTRIMVEANAWTTLARLKAAKLRRPNA